MLGSARRADADEGGPADVAAEMETALRDAAKAAEVEPAALRGRRRRLARARSTTAT